MDKTLGDIRQKDGDIVDIQITDPENNPINGQVVFKGLGNTYLIESEEEFPVALKDCDVFAIRWVQDDQPLRARVFLHHGKSVIVCQVEAVINKGDYPWPPQNEAVVAFDVRKGSDNIQSEQVFRLAAKTAVPVIGMAKHRIEHDLPVNDAANGIVWEVERDVLPPFDRYLKTVRRLHEDLEAHFVLREEERGFSVTGRILCKDPRIAEEAVAHTAEPIPHAGQATEIVKQMTGRLLKDARTTLQAELSRLSEQSNAINQLLNGFSPRKTAQ